MRSILLVLVFGVFALLGWRILGPLFAHPIWFGAVSVFFAVGFAALAWLPLYYWNSDSPEVSRLEAAIERVAHIAMGMISLLLLCVVLREVTSLFVPKLAGAAGSLAVVFSAVTLFGLGFFFASRGPTVRRVVVEIGKPLPPGFSLRIAQVSDLHVGNWIREKYVRRVVEKISREGPIDLFVLTGDIGDGNPDGHRRDLAPLAEIAAAIGRFSVTGNHEGYWSEAGWNREIAHLGFRILGNESALVMKDGTPIRIAGISDLQPDVARASAEVTPDVFSILLAHQPKHAAAAKKQAIRLQLSGHTHAGQFVPWSWMIGFFHRHPRGLYREGDFSIYVNEGTGFWGPPLRLGSRSEITLLEIRG